jgi:enoyl-CoA hydratase
MNEASFLGPENSMWQLRQTKVPVIAAVAGPCITGGMELALNCDIIIASPSAFFQDTHARYGIVPGGGMTSLLPRSVGLHAAKWASLVCQRIPADRAHQLGLIAKV